MQLSLSQKVFRWHPLNIMSQLTSHDQYSKLCSYNYLCSYSIQLQLAKFWWQLISKFLVTCVAMQLCSYRQITAACYWPCAFLQSRCFCLAYHCFLSYLYSVVQHTLLCIRMLQFSLDGCVYLLLATSYSYVQNFSYYCNIEHNNDVHVYPFGFIAGLNDGHNHSQLYTYVTNLDTSISHMLQLSQDMQLVCIQLHNYTIVHSMHCLCVHYSCLSFA